jgi:hypothetical protein
MDALLDRISDLVNRLYCSANWQHQLSGTFVPVRQTRKPGMMDLG